MDARKANSRWQWSSTFGSENKGSCFIASKFRLFGYATKTSKVNFAMMAVEIKNKKASYTYFLTDEFTAGIVLSGSEIKSIRAGKASITESYCRFEKGELWVHNMYVAEYANAGYSPQDPRQKRKLLLQRAELKKLAKKVKDVGVTLVPTRLFIASSGYAKLEFSVAKGKKLHDKRQSIKEKDVARDVARMTD